MGLNRRTIVSKNIIWTRSKSEGIPFIECEYYGLKYQAWLDSAEILIKDLEDDESIVVLPNDLQEVLKSYFKEIAKE